MAQSPYAKLFATLGNILPVEFVSAVHLTKHQVFVYFVLKAVTFRQKSEPIYPCWGRELLCVCLEQTGLRLVPLFLHQFQCMRACICVCVCGDPHSVCCAHRCSSPFSFCAQARSCRFHFFLMQFLMAFPWQPGIEGRVLSSKHMVHCAWLGAGGREPGWANGACMQMLAGTVYVYVEQGGGA